METILREILAFRNERDWEQFRLPKNLAESISIEAAELLQSWNLHVFMRPAAPAGSSRHSNPILPSDVIFVEPPQTST